jgi:hypothetical protein
LRSTIFILKVLSTFIQIFVVNRVQTKAEHIENGPAALCTATSRPRARALGVRARAPPDAPPPEVAHRPRPRAFPRPTPRPRHLGLSPPLHHTCVVHAADRRSVRGAARTRVGRGAPWYDDILAVTATSWSSALFKHRRSLPCATPSRWPPLSPSRQARMLASILGRLTILTYSLGPLEACAVAHLLGSAPPHRSRSTPRPSPPAIAVGRRRVPFRPNTEHQRALGELTLLPTPFPGRSPRRRCRISASHAASHGQGPHCKGSNLYRGLSAKLKLQ